MTPNEKIQILIEERVRIASQLKRLAQIMLQTPNNSPADGYTAAIVKGFAEMIENDATGLEVPKADPDPDRGTLH